MQLSFSSLWVLLLGFVKQNRTLVQSVGCATAREGPGSALPSTHWSWVCLPGFWSGWWEQLTALGEHRPVVLPCGPSLPSGTLPLHRC